MPLLSTLKPSFWRLRLAKVLVVMLLIHALLMAGLAQAAEVRAVRLWNSKDHTRAVFDLNQPVDYQISSLANPDRLVIDVKGAKVRGALNPPAKGVIAGFRSGTPNPNQLRLVFDLTEKVRTKSFQMQPSEKHPQRLVIDLYPETTTSVPTVIEAPAAIKSGRNLIIAIDAGHGGEDPGAIGKTGIYEKDITLAIALALAKRVNNEAGMEAHLVRDSDFFVPLQKRFEKARDAKADLFISIHADAFSQASVSGSSVWVLSQRGADSEAARYLSDVENRSDLVGGVSLDDKDPQLAELLMDLSQNITSEQSYSAAENVLASLKAFGKTHRRQVDRANFVVLRSPDVASMLIETGFISNPKDEKNLSNKAYRGRLADAILDGIREHFQSSPVPGTWLAQNTTPRRHIVKRGESLSEIAQRHGVTVAKLRSANRLRSDALFAGSVLKIPK
jgi:N-acetylmuramoyl-L-alanine amidase